MPNSEIAFILQFHQEGIMLPFIDHRSKNMCSRCFAGTRKERHHLRKFMERTIDEGRIMRELMAALKNEDLNITGRLIQLMAGLLDTFAADIRREPYAASWYAAVPKNIRQFLQLLHSDDNPHVALYNKLTELTDRPASSHAGAGRHMRRLLTALRTAGDIMYGYYDVFTSLTGQERIHTGKSAITSRIGQRLTRIIQLLESLIDATRRTCSRLVEWQERLRRIQKQEIYN